MEPLVNIQDHKWRHFIGTTEYCGRWLDIDKGLMILYNFDYSQSLHEHLTVGPL